MTTAGPGPKMILDQVEAAERVVAHSGAGRALAETLSQLQTDLARTRQTLLAGSDQASQVAGRVEVGLGGGAGSISSQL